MAQNPVDWFVECFGNAVRDIRQRVVEEPFFGRIVTPQVVEPDRSIAEALGWDTPHQSRQAPTHPEMDHDR